MPLFDRYLIVDWSASNAPKTGKDSIWMALSEGTDLVWVHNAPTRLEAMALIRKVVELSLSSQKRLFMGFDFAFGYPAGAAARIGGRANWEAVWGKMAELIVDDEHNVTNTYEIAGQLNQTAFDGLTSGPFWGHPYQHAERYAGLEPTKPRHVFGSLSEFRHAERAHKGAKSLWQMAGAGVVAAQSMTGMKHLQSLRNDPQFADNIAVWPFETHFADDLTRPVTIAEIYPAIFDVQPEENEVMDAAQVRVVAQEFSEADEAGRFSACLEFPKDQSAGIRSVLEQEEGWIVSAPQARVEAQYLRDPAQIYTKSFDTIVKEADLTRVPNQMRDIAIRLIHSCGMVDIVDDLAFSQDCVQAGAAALSEGSAIICDVEMVRHGIIQSNLEAGNEVLCAVAKDEARTHALEIGNTRSAAAMDLLKSMLGGSIVVIGNAPTALFRLLELMDSGAEKPGLIIGMPVGFVGAMESKEALIADSRGVPYISVRGRRGGSAMASATLNALSSGLKGGH